MANTTSTHNEKCTFINIKDFPPVINGKINAVKFLEAAFELLRVVDSLGKLFAPIKYDMEGNINKIKKLDLKDDSCLLELMLDECAKGKPVATEGLLWLNRTLCFIEVMFREVLSNLQTDNLDISMKKIYTVAYEASVKQYHNWVTQQLFGLICRMSPSLFQLLRSFEADKDIEAFKSKVENFNITLHLVRCKIDDFYRDNDLIVK